MLDVLHLNNQLEKERDIDDNFNMHASFSAGIGTPSGW
jgi:hypothetical protein